MSKALIIKGVDFSDNALDTIVISNPCTGIEFETDTFSFDGYDTETIEYTVTPADTSDPVTWASSNTDIVTVSNGVITVVGIGNCTVTATCGGYTATATITVAMSVSINWVFGYCGKVDYTPAMGSFYQSYSYVAATGSGDFATEHPLQNNDVQNLKCIKLPKNVASVTVTTTNASKLRNHESTTAVHFYKDEGCGQQTFPNCIVHVDRTLYNIRTDTTKTVAVPSGTNAFTFHTMTDSASSSSDVASDIASGAGLTITLNPVVES